MKKLFIGLVMFLAFACAPLTTDPSMGAVQANDYTLIGSVCSAAPGRGVDSCVVKAGSPISSNWIIVVPAGDKLKSGELNVQYRGVSKDYTITGTTVSVPLQDLFGHSTWQIEDSGTAVAYAHIVYKTNTGEDVVVARGFAFFIVTDASYDPLPMDSGSLAAFQTTCKVFYTTAGRSNISCK